MKKRIKSVFSLIENAPSVEAIRSGLIMIIPLLMIGSITLVIRSFPVAGYQDFISTVFSGNLLAFLNFIYNATFGMMSIFLTVAISYSYARTHTHKRILISPCIVSLICFFVLSGVLTADATWDALGVKGMFIAIISAVFATKLFLAILSRRDSRRRGYTDGTDINFNDSVSVIFPALAVVVVFALVNTVLINIFDANSFFELFVEAANGLFLPLGRSFFAGLLFVVVSSILWFFGIHGSNVLESVMDKVFTPAIETNMALAAEGIAPTEILTKQFFDVFVLMGGCGTAICLLLAILIFSKRKSNRRISRLAAVPMIFNINELMVFGLPIIFNPTMLFPFVVTPVVCFFTTYLAMSAGLVPLTVSQVNWTAPVLFSGYIATGSLWGSVIQLVNIIIGVLIYSPFVMAYDRRRDEAAKKQLDELINILKKSEATVTPVVLTEIRDEHGALARFLSSDLKHAIAEKDIKLFYQPQYNNKNECIGIEALLRWNHPSYGMIYPPLVIQLARETNILTELEEYVVMAAVADAERFREETGFSQEVDINVSAETLRTDSYMELLEELSAQGISGEYKICLEITEQTALGDISERLVAVKKLGYHLAIDDFSMGHTSLAYLQDNHFDTVKLDGSLVTGMTTNPRSLDIIKSITSLSQTLGFKVIAEYVEDELQMRMLEAAGCTQYQGYLFSRAIDGDALVERFLSERQNASAKQS